MAEMDDYNKASSAVQAQADGMTMPVSAVDSALNDAAPAESASATQLDATVTDAIPEGTNDGKRTDDLKDGTLFFTKGENEDIDRAASEQAPPQPKRPKNTTSNPKPASDDRSRKDRIWDYIKDDQSTGGIDHDL